MLKYVLLSAIAVLFILLSGCAVMDLSMQESAIPRDTTGVEFSAFVAQGPALGGYIIQDKYSSKHEYRDDDWVLFYAILGTAYYLSTYTHGVKAIIPLGQKTDFVGRIYTTGFGTLWGTRLGVKHLIKKRVPKLNIPDNGSVIYTSIYPSVVLGYSTYGKETSKGELLITGADCQVLSSYVLENKDIVTFGLRAGYEFFDRTRYDSDFHAHIIHFGAALNRQMNFDPWIITPEIGCEVYPFKDSGVLISPFISLGIAFK